jgi:hypothetical protein
MAPGKSGTNSSEFRPSAEPIMSIHSFDPFLPHSPHAPWATHAE